ncbi:MAG: hypothetical protein J5902_05640 [Paludibacteraceae bacterium]|nr:hypothetical protein [Paludibacteraceae bacterium]
MQIRYYLYKFLLMAWLLMPIAGVSASNANDRTPAYASWGYKPLYSTATAKPQGRVYQLSGSVPTYHFRSTSPYSYVPGQTTTQSSVPSVLPSRPRKVGEGGGSEWNWGDPGEEDPIGVMPDPQPVGEPLVLLLMAALYLLCARLYGKRKQRL